MKYRFLLLFSAAVLLFSPALADTTDDTDTMQVVIENPLLAYGMTGEEVSQLQLQLAKLGYYDGEITGSYGDLTKAAVKAFQVDFSLLQTGEADAETQELIFSTEHRPLRLGSVGEDVRQLQIRLSTLGYYEGKISGTYLPATQEAVALFQQCAGEESTGLADVDTLFLVYADDALTYQEGVSRLPEATPAPTGLEAEIDLTGDDVIYLTPAPTVQS